MKTKEFIKILEENKGKLLQFEYSKGQFTRADFHLTEIKNVTYDTVDCGGLQNKWEETIVQIWENEVPDGNLVDTTKALEIFERVDKVRPIFKETEIKFEYSNSIFHTSVMPVSEVVIGDRITVKLFIENTTCKAQDRAVTDEEKANACCPPVEKQKINLERIEEASCCDPSSDCC
ncbi:TPA: hypothetical protein EYP45_00635 [Candidatus Peregrinibacteria bacterium]|nr:hypothetical protein [Candidatus Peregrinibacteria bacterium]